MTQRTVAVNFTANVAPYVAGVGKATAATTALGTSAATTNAAMAGRTGLAAGAKQALQAFLPLPPALIGAGGVAYALKSVVSAAIDFESAMAGVRKTVDVTDAEFATLTDGIRQMSLEVPTAAEEIAGVTEAAGQLGIQTPNLLGFTRTMIDLGESTNLSSQQAAMSLARLANITQMSQTDFDRLGSTIVDLGNNMATTEAEIVDMAMGIAGAGNIVGLTEPQMLAFAATLSSVGIEAEAGGTAISRTFLEIMNAVQSGNERLDVFAKTAKMSVDDFAALFREDAAAATLAFVQGLQQMQAEGGNLMTVLEEVGLSDIRVRRALLNMAGAGDLLADSINIANEAWDENIALTEEAERRYATTESGLRLLANTFKDIARDIGEDFTPAVDQAARGLSERYQEQRRREEETGIQNTLLGFIPNPAAVFRDFDYWMSERAGLPPALIRDRVEAQAALEAAAENAAGVGRNWARGTRESAEAAADVTAIIEDLAESLGMTTDEYERQTEAIDAQRRAQLALIDPVYAAIEAERDLREATEELATAQERLAVLPSEVAAAQQALTDALGRQNSAATDLAGAEERVQSLEDEGARGTEAYADAREWLAGAKRNDADASRDVAAAQQRLNDLNAEAAEIDDRLVDALFDLTTAEIERNAAMANAELVSEGFRDTLGQLVQDYGLSSEATETLRERLNDLGIEVNRFDLDPVLRQLRDSITANEDLQGAFEDSGMSAEDFKTEVLLALYRDGELTLERFTELVREVNSFGDGLDEIDGRVTQSEHTHIVTTIERSIRGEAPGIGLAGVRARGGPVDAGRAYLVGEQGPELMVPRQSGTILNAAQMAASGIGGGRGITIQNYTTVRQVDDDVLLAKLEWAQERGRL